MVHVTPHSHTQATGKGLEDTFYLMVLIGAFGFYVQIDARAVGEALEEVKDEVKD